MLPNTRTAYKEKAMRTIQELYIAVDEALNENDWCEIEDIVLETLHHLPDFADDQYEMWNANDVKNLCQALGNKVFDKWGISELKNIRLTVECEMSEYAARFLDIFWSRHLGMPF